MSEKSLSNRRKPVLLDKKFWQSFATTYWEKKPLVLKNVKSDLLEMSDVEIFDLLVLYSDRCRKLNNPEGFKFYIDGFKADTDDVLQVLPEKEDRSLLGYHQRMNALFSDYCLVCDELLSVNLKKQHLLTDFTDELYRHVGFPNRFSEMGLYLGNYRKTPFGVHVDSCGVFSFPVFGKKKFRLWTSAFAKKNPGLNRTFKYDKFKKSSQLLEVGPGDMTYWPSSAWHIAESDGSFSATWSLGVWVDQPLKNLVSQSLNELFHNKLGSFGAMPTTPFKSLHSTTGEVTDLPDAYLQSIHLLKSITTLELKDALLKYWMQHTSLQGFKTLPQVQIKLSIKSHIKLRNKKAMILWQNSLTSQKNIYFSFGGVLAEGSKSSGLLKIVTALNTGQTCLVSDFIKGTKQTKDLSILQTLAEAGAFLKG